MGPQYATGIVGNRGAQITSATGDFPKQTSLCNAVRVCWRAGMSARSMSRLALYRQLFEFAKLEKVLDFLSPIGSGFCHWRMASVSLGMHCINNNIYTIRWIFK